MEDGHGLVGTQVGGAIVGQEAKDLSLWLVFGPKALSVHWYGETKGILWWWLVQILKAHVALKLVWIDFNIEF